MPPEMQLKLPDQDLGPSPLRIPRLHSLAPAERTSCILLATRLLLEPWGMDPTRSSQLVLLVHEYDTSLLWIHLPQAWCATPLQENLSCLSIMCNKCLTAQRAGGAVRVSDQGCSATLAPHWDSPAWWALSALLMCAHKARLMPYGLEAQSLLCEAACFIH